jgi:UDP-N-acetylmuramate-alanine ligase
MRGDYARLTEIDIALSTTDEVLLSEYFNMSIEKLINLRQHRLLTEYTIATRLGKSVKEINQMIDMVDLLLEKKELLLRIGTGDDTKSYSVV